MYLALPLVGELLPGSQGPGFCQGFRVQGFGFRASGFRFRGTAGMEGGGGGRDGWNDFCFYFGALRSRCFFFFFFFLGGGGGKQGFQSKSFAQGLLRPHLF